VEAALLPAATARVWELAVTHTYTVAGKTYSRTHYQDLAQTWRAPLAGTPLYEPILRWGGEWVDAAVADTGEAAENVLAEKLLFGMRALEDLGYSYGAFPRPSEIRDRAEVFLDFKRSACGEFRGFFMALVETQGIDANWLWYWFNKPSSPGTPCMKPASCGARAHAPVWRYQIHRGGGQWRRVRPHLRGDAADADAYEDFMFARFCFGEDVPASTLATGARCRAAPRGSAIDNPPGYDASIGPAVFAVKITADSIDSVDRLDDSIF
jgi:hypothetical protein